MRIVFSSRPLILSKRKHQTGGDLIALDRIRLGEIGLHVLDEGFGDLHRQV
jgi:hypothetical protein